MSTSTTKLLERAQGLAWPPVMFDSGGRFLEGETGWRSRLAGLPPAALATVESRLTELEERRSRDAERDSRERAADLAAGRVAPATPEERERAEADARELADLRAAEDRETREAYEEHQRRRPERVEELLTRCASALESLVRQGRG